MTETKRIGARGEGLLVVSGLLTLFLSLQTWGVCPTTPCGGHLMTLSWYSGLDLGFGVVTALAGLGLIAVGFVALLRNGGSRFATAAVLLAGLIVTTAVASVIWMYVIPGEDTNFYWPPYSAILVAVLGLIAFAAGSRLRHAWT